MAANRDNGNGRITLAIIGTKLDMLIEEVGELKTDFKSKCKQIDTNTTAIGVLQESAEHAKYGIRAWNIINTLGVIAAWVLGITR